MFKKYLGVAGIVCTIGLTACGSSDSNGSTTPATTTAVQTTSVLLQAQGFTPPSILVSPGATVTFSNRDEIAHNVTFDDTAIPRTGDFTTGAKSLTMPLIKGLYGYHCTIHPGMTGTVRVE